MNHSILLEAAEIRNGCRNSDYGDAVENFNRIAQMASLMTGIAISPDQCVAVLMAVKLCREGFNHKRDNLVDLCGYADILELIKEHQIQTRNGTERISENGHDNVHGNLQ